MKSVEGEQGLPRPYGAFVLFDQIGQGGMAKIFLARNAAGLAAERLLVVKQILPVLSESEQFAKLFIDEAKLSAKLTHGNIVQVLDLGRADGQLYIAMEYVEGFDLRELLRQCAKRKVPLPVEFSLLLAKETLRALDYAHRKCDEDGTPLRIVHRDVSPSNVLISLDGEVKLCDFGIARALGSDTHLPSEAVQGKAGYMSPEAASGDAVDARSDVFSVGVMLWETLAGRRLYKNPQGGPPTLEMAMAAQIPELPSRGCPDEPVLYGIIQRALAKDVDARFPSTADMLEALEDYSRSHRLMASPLKFGDWLMEEFGEQLVQRRSERERASHQVTGSGPPPPMPDEPSLVTESGPAPKPTPTSATESGKAPRSTPEVGDAVQPSQAAAQSTPPPKARPEPQQRTSRHGKRSTAPAILTAVVLMCLIVALVMGLVWTR